MTKPEFDILERKAIEAAMKVRTHARTYISEHPVGAAVIATNGKDWDVFEGCNIEYSTGNGFHAEIVAMNHAILKGYSMIQSIFATSSSKEEIITLCGICRQFAIWVNKEMDIYIINPDGTIKVHTTLRDVEKYGYFQGGRINKHKPIITFDEFSGILEKMTREQLQSFVKRLEEVKIKPGPKFIYTTKKSSE